MKQIIIIGSGARECAILRYLQKRKLDKQNYKWITIGTNRNPYIEANSEFRQVQDYSFELIYLELLRIFDRDRHQNTDLSKLIDFVFIGPEKPITEGVSNYLNNRGIFCIAPFKEGALIESSKKFARNFINDSLKSHLNFNSKLCIDLNPRYISLKTYLFDQSNNNLLPITNDVLQTIKILFDSDIVIKKDGLCGGKGVYVEGDHFDLGKCDSLIKQLNNYINCDDGNDIIVEEKLEGLEFSLLTFVDQNENCVHMNPVFDYKRLNDNNKGPNTGSMGSVMLDKTKLERYLPQDVVSLAKKVNTETIVNLNKQVSDPYHGILYGSYMLTTSGELKLIEFNCRMGDPEGILCLQDLESNFLDLCLAIKNGELDNYCCEFKGENIVGIYMVPELYPEKPDLSININYNIYMKDKMTKEFNKLFNSNVFEDNDAYKYDTTEGIELFYGDCYVANCNLYCNRSRTLFLSSNSNKLYKAYHTAYEAVKLVISNLHYRTDIGAQFLDKYELSGVSIDAANEGVNNIKNIVGETYNENVLSKLGDFGGIYNLNGSHLVSSIDGVGTKTCFVDKYFESWSYHGLGEDIVNHCINDILVMGARPLFFLDYYGAHQLNTSQFNYFIKGASAALKISANETVPLIGGETAEMASTYKAGKNEIVGCIIGKLDRSFITFKRQPQRSDVLLALPSVGPHTNGFSLINKVDWKAEIKDNFTFLEIIEKLRSPHKNYYEDIKRISNGYGNDSLIRMCHITGGGLTENLNRVIPDGVKIEYDSRTLSVLYPAWCNEIEKALKVSHDEMYRVFNCGIGFVLIVDQQIGKKLLLDKTLGIYEIGHLC